MGIKEYTFNEHRVSYGSVELLEIKLQCMLTNFNLNRNLKNNCLEALNAYFTNI